MELMIRPQVEQNLRAVLWLNIKGGLWFYQT